MGGLNFLGLNIEGPGIYFGGQTVNGQVIVDASEEQTNIKSVEVKLKGKGEVHFTETVRCDMIYFDIQCRGTNCGDQSLAHNGPHLFS